MIKETIKWYSVKDDGLPKESGDYLTVSIYGHVTTLMYSVKHKAFNCFNGQTKKRAMEVSIEVEYWAELPKVGGER